MLHNVPDTYSAITATCGNVFEVKVYRVLALGSSSAPTELGSHLWLTV